MGAITALGSPTKKIDSMLKFGDGYAKQIEKQKKVLEGLCIRIDEIQVNIESYRKHKSVQPKNNADSTSMPQKIKALEYRLSTQLQKFNQAVAENKSMRERIDQLRKERVVFDMIYRQLESDIKGKREELIAIMAKTDKAEKARDESRTELDKLKVESSKLKELFQNEWNEVVEKSLKEQNETTFSLGAEKDKAAEAIKVVSIKEETASITKSGKKDKNAKNSSERKGGCHQQGPRTSRGPRGKHLRQQIEKHYRQSCLGSRQRHRVDPRVDAEGAAIRGGAGHCQGGHRHERLPSRGRGALPADRGSELLPIQLCQRAKCRARTAGRGDPRRRREDLETQILRHW